MLLILIHVGLVYFGVERSSNAVTQAVYDLGVLLESPGTFVLNFLGSNLPNFVAPNGFFAVALTALALYFIVHLLLGFGRN